MTSGVEEDVFRFEIPIDDVEFVQVFESEDEFGDVKLGTILSEPGFSLEMPKELATALEIGDEIELSFCLETEF